MPGGEIRCLLWDFGDTLCNERFIWDSGHEWIEVYKTFDDGLGRRWNLGEIDAETFSAEVGMRVGADGDAVLAFMRERCRHIEFFPKTLAYFQEKRLPQAIVTVNPEIFTETIVPLYDLDAYAPVIVTSGAEKTLDKGRLCEIAIERMGLDVDPSEALLIDNREDYLATWDRRGGATYLHRGDDAFATDIGTLLP